MGKPSRQLDITFPTETEKPVYHFSEDLEFSNKVSIAPWWETVYRTAFVCYERSELITNKQEQHQGIDKKIYLTNQKILLVDEKILKKEWPHILLERWSDRDKKIPGWIQKENMLTDFIAYAFLPSKRCFVLPFKPLQRAWRDNHKNWIQKAYRAKYDNERNGFMLSLAQNPSYVTEGICVPIPKLLHSLQQALFVKW